jgi:hypothetical protein
MDHPFEYVRSDHRPEGVGSDGMPLNWVESDLWRCDCCGEEVWDECAMDYDPDERPMVLHGHSDPMSAIVAEGRNSKCPEDFAIVYEVMTR